MSTSSQQQVEATFTQLERKGYAQLKAEERAGYLLYRSQQKLENANRQGSVILKKWKGKLTGPQKAYHVREGRAGFPFQPEKRPSLHTGLGEAPTIVSPKASGSVMSPDSTASTASGVGETTTGEKKRKRHQDDESASEKSSKRSRSCSYDPPEGDDDVIDRAEDLDNAAGKWELIQVLHDSKYAPNKTRNHVHVGLYCKVDDQGIINDRVVIKMITRDPETPQNDTREVEVMDCLAECANLVENRTRQRDDHGGRPNVRCTYTDFAPHGDLGSFIDAYGGKEPIPESFIWHVFEGLAEAVFTLQTGRCAHERVNSGKGIGRDLAPDYKPMLHLDIKPENVFFGAPKKGETFPTPKLGDFGHTLELNDHTAKKRRGKRALGTPGWQAPEALYRKHDRLLSDKTDIWGIGMIIWKMMHATLGPEKLFKMADDAAENAAAFMPGDTMPLGRHYSESHHVDYSPALRRLVARCLRVDPAERPGFYELRNIVGRECGKKHKGPDGELPLFTDEYPIGMYLPEERSSEGGDDVQGHQDGDSLGGDSEMSDGEE